MARDVAEALARLGRRPLVIASHPRSGTHLAIDLFRKQFRECDSWKLPGEKLNRLYVSLEAVFSPAAKGPITQAKAIGVLQRVARPVIKTHLPWDELWGGPATRQARVSPVWRDWLRANADLVYVYRDGRDVMCSFHLFKKGSDPSARCPVGEFLRQDDAGASRPAAWARHVRGWLGAEGVHTLRFEDAITRPRQVIERFAQEFSLSPRWREPLLPRRFSGNWDSRLHRLLAFRSESSAILGRHKGERLERWREAFTPEDRAFFDEQAGDLLRELRYEDSSAWVNGQP